MTLAAGFAGVFGDQLRPTVAVSPDGRMLALTGGENSGGRMRIYLRRLDELEATPVPRFSPDGRRIVVGSGGDRWGYSRGVARDLWTLDRNSGQATRLTRTGTASAPGWTPDGRRVVYVQEEPRERRCEVWILPLDGSAEASRLAAVECAGSTARARCR